MNELIKLVEQWASNKELDKADPKAQFLKVIEETGELAEGMAKDQSELIVDAFGDVLVTLIILNQQLNNQAIINYDLEECLTVAYQEIANRKGEMRNGTFVKEDDLR